MMAVRAKATTGFISGKAAVSGRRVNPIARRAGTTSSSALQIVGVSNAFSASRSARFGRRGMAGFLKPSSAGSRFIEIGRARQGISGARDFRLGADHEAERNDQRQDDERDR